MAFFKFRTRGPQGNEGRNTPAPAPAESVETLRRRARHRLIGAAVLVLLGVVGFPLLFDTQPRPVAVDIPIEIPDRAKAPALPVPAAVAPAARESSAPVTAAPPRASAMITETADGTEIPAVKPASRPEPKPVQDVKPKPEVKADSKPETRPELKPEPAAAKPATATSGDDGARARALLDGKPPATKAGAAEEVGRFVVQVGAFADPDKAREARQKLEKAGLKTYVHVAKTADGERIRVRVGPFGNRTDADRAAGKVKGLSLPAAVLSL